MSQPVAHVGALTLAREEIRALPRSTFALGGVAVLLGLAAAIASLALSEPDGLRDLLVFTWVVAELAVAIVVASRVAAARRTRFVESLYTTPLRQRTWLAAQAMVGAFLAALVLAAQLPFVAVYVLHLGVPADLLPVLAAAVGTACFAVALGLFCGVVVGEAGPGAASALAGGAAFAAFVLLLVHGLAVTMPDSPTRLTLLRVTALSPLALAVDAAGLGLFSSAPEEPWRPLAGLAAIVGGLGAAAAVAYLRAQSPLGWGLRRGRAAVVGLVALALVLPVATAATSFRDVHSDEGPSRAQGDHAKVGFVPRGAPVTDEAFTLGAFYSMDELLLGQDRALDVLVLLVVPDGAQVRQVRIEVAGSDAVEVVEGGRINVPDGAPAGHARTTDAFGDASPTATPKPVYRVPIVLRPVSVTALLESPSPVTIETTFVMDGRTYASSAHFLLPTDVPGASAQLLAAGAPLPLLALATIAIRKIRTR